MELNVSSSGAHRNLKGSLAPVYRVITWIAPGAHRELTGSSPGAQRELTVSSQRAQMELNGSSPGLTGNSP